MLGFIKKHLVKAYTVFASKLSTLFSGKKLDESFLQELSKLLIEADVGVKTTRSLVSNLSSRIAAGQIVNSEQAAQELEKMLFSTLQGPEIKPVEYAPRVVLLVGINGSGKTTFASKYAHYMREQGKRVLLVAADTFRAAGATQLEKWGEKIGIDVFAAHQDKDPASVIFDACQVFAQGKYDHMIVDTAGRLQTKTNLMRELEKVRRVLAKQFENHDIATWLTIDTMIGQNSYIQAQVFHEATNVDGLVITKMDSTAKGGIVFSIVQQFKLPIVYVTYGEGIQDISPFNAQEYVSNLMKGSS